jgi:hypothetical protein
MYGPMEEYEAKRIRNIFLDADEDKLEFLDPPLCEYDDFRVREHEVTSQRKSAAQRRTEKMAARQWAEGDANRGKRRPPRRDLSAYPPGARAGIMAADAQTGASRNEQSIKIKVKRKKVVKT